MIHKQYMIVLLCALVLFGCQSHSDIKDRLTFKEYVDMAHKYVGAGDNEKAISAYKSALQIKPDDANTHFELGQLYHAEWDKSYNEALKKYTADMLMNRDKRQITDVMDELKRYGLKSEYKELSVSEFQETVKYAPENWKARYYIATDHLNNKRYKDAIAEYKKAIELNPKDSDLYNLMAAAYAGNGEYDLAIENFTKAYQFSGDAEEYYYRLGKVYILTNNTEKAAEMFRKLKEMKSRHYDDLMTYKYFPKTRN